MVANLKFRYHNFIQTNHLKSSKRRDLIFDYIVKCRNHFTVDEIYQQMLKIDSEIGIATLYRTVRLLVDCGVLLEHTFGEKKGYFEVNQIDAKHHDHLICTSCGKIIEFHYNTIEKDKKRIAEQHRFQIHSYKLEIYGLCNKCQ